MITTDAQAATSRRDVGEVTAGEQAADRQSHAKADSLTQRSATSSTMCDQEAELSHEVDERELQAD
ncbi:hypothetical protein ACQR2B_29295 [Bradyrhizobium oligotrophicum]|uniref:hypothetical protein n=1 Tax=Bradyrhizobium TaxID=374 RepID=UPI003EBEEA09